VNLQKLHSCATHNRSRKRTVPESLRLAPINTCWLLLKNTTILTSNILLVLPDLRQVLKDPPALIFFVHYFGLINTVMYMLSFFHFSLLCIISLFEYTNISLSITLQCGLLDFQWLFE
jgi:hypothetical protein